MIFKTMKQADVLKALEGHTNIIDPEVRELEAFFRRLQCVSCGGEVQKILNPKKLFREGSILPNYLAKCKACETEFEPYTGIQLTPPR